MATRKITRAGKRAPPSPKTCGRSRFCATARKLIAEVEGVRSDWRDGKLTDAQAIQQLKTMHVALLAAGRLHASTGRNHE